MVKLYMQVSKGQEPVDGLPRAAWQLAYIAANLSAAKVSEVFEMSRSLTPAARARQ